MKPKLTVVVPTLDRPELAKIAVDSVIGQDGEYSTEIIVSNNGANKKTREIFTSEIYNKKITYIESKEVLPMPVHWERATSLATGEYVMVLPDRRLLKQGAVKQLISSLDNNQDCEASCCCWDEINESGRLVTTRTFVSDTKLSTKEILKKIESGLADGNSLPRGLNCIIRNDFLKKYRDTHGQYFDSISADFRSAFNFLFTANMVYIIAEPLMIATGFKHSNGGKVLSGDPAYFKTLGRDGEFTFMPQCFQDKMSGSIYEDYLRSKFFFKMDGDYKKIMSKSTMLYLMTEEMTKALASRFNRSSWSNYREVRRVLKACGWETLDDLKAAKNVFFGLKQFLPEPVKKFHRKFYTYIYNKERDVLRVAGF